MELDPPDDFFELTTEDLVRLQQQANAKKQVSGAAVWPESVRGGGGLRKTCRAARWLPHTLASLPPIILRRLPRLWQLMLSEPGRMSRISSPSSLPRRQPCAAAHHPLATWSSGNMVPLVSVNHMLTTRTRLHCTVPVLAVPAARHPVQAPLYAQGGISSPSSLPRPHPCPSALPRCNIVLSPPHLCIPYVQHPC
jgi:hypothetical protein